jgi:hypothetical protein
VDYGLNELIKSAGGKLVNTSAWPKTASHGINALSRGDWAKPAPNANLN